MSYSSDEEVTYHDSMLSFNDGKEFFEEVLGGMANASDSESEASDKSETSDSESSEESECGCPDAASEDESPFIFDGGDEVNEASENNSPFIFDEAFSPFSSVSSTSVPEVEETEEKGNENESPFIKMSGGFIHSEESDEKDLNDIQNIIGGMLGNF